MSFSSRQSTKFILMVVLAGATAFVVTASEVQQFNAATSLDDLVASMTTTSIGSQDVRSVTSPSNQRIFSITQSYSGYSVTLAKSPPANSSIRIACDSRQNSSGCPIGIDALNRKLQELGLPALKNNRSSGKTSEGVTVNVQVGEFGEGLYSDHTHRQVEIDYLVQTAPTGEVKLW